VSRKPSTKLAVVQQPPEQEQYPPPPDLNETGAALWRDIVSVYEFSDLASYETLFQVCASADRATECAEEIAKTGVLMRNSNTGTVRGNPLIKDELALRAFICMALARLGLDLEPLRDRPGRPPNAY
jgi:hypothetical protein